MVSLPVTGAALGLEQGAVAVSLGKRILRTETAGLVGLSLILYEWGDLGGAISA